jgi:hypothetical protein
MGLLAGLPKPMRDLSRLVCLLSGLWLMSWAATRWLWSYHGDATPKTLEDGRRALVTRGVVTIVPESVYRETRRRQMLATAAQVLVCVPVFVVTGALILRFILRRYTEMWRETHGSGGEP